MKISFSTLACPEWSWADICSIAKDLKFNGIEVRGIGDEIFSVKVKSFTEQKLKKTIRKLTELNLEIPCLSSGACLKYAENFSDTKAEITAYAKLAKKLNTPYIRVLADDNYCPDSEVNDDVVLELLAKLVPVAEEYNVTLLVETNGVYSDTARLARLLDRIESRKVSALWDMHHPYRFAGESPETTVSNLGEYIKFVQVKDSFITSDGNIEYCMTGEGDIPIKEMLSALESINYIGYVSIEWIKRRATNLSDAGIVIPQFAEFMRPYQTKHKHSLQDNMRNNGKYPWPKDRIINYTFPDVLDRICEEFPNQYAFRYTELDYTRTYHEFRDDVDTFACALLAMGVKKGDHVAIWATNVPQWYITFWSVTKIGAVLVTMNSEYRIHEAEYLLKQSDTSTLVMIDGIKGIRYVDIIKELCPELETCEAGKLSSERLPFLRNVITINSENNGCYTWEQALELSKNVPYSEVEKIRRTIDIHDVCNMQYTSGTTGFPKGVMLTHYNVVNNGKAIGDCMDLSTADRMMIQVPMFHCFGMVLAMTAGVTHCVTMSPVTKFAPRKALDCINKEKITCFHGVPTMFISMLGHRDFNKTDFSYMRTGIMAGSPCPIKTMEEVIEKMNMKEICITYGQTEASPAITMSKTTDSIQQRVNTVGTPIFGVECRIVDPETNQELPDDTDGELVARGYNIMKGYYKMPEATANAIDSQGWLHTGDLARRCSADGYYKITGRIKDMIIRGGENIYPKEIEDFLYTNPKIKDVQVIGVPSENYGEEIMACIVLKEGETATPLEIKKFCRQRMASHKCPKYIDFVDGFPMNAAGKILKYKMREQAVQKLSLQKAEEIVTA
ncbi:MAG: AMP-binding protein [Ruminococcus sp.]|nr:AMP-binding protein [Ruminococcus sp.]